MTAANRRRTTAFLACLAVGLLNVACQTGSGRPPRLTVDRPDALFDAPLSIQVNDVAPFSEVTVQARTADGVWTSSARFDVGPDGRVDLATAAPTRGSSYSGADAMGLFWSLHPRDPSIWNAPPTTHSPPPTTPGDWVVELSARVAGGPAATRTIRRLVVAPGASMRPLSPTTDGVFGQLYLPPRGAAAGPPALVFGGSEGGLSTARTAALLASHGHPALSLAYFAEPGLPPTLENIPLEYFVKAIAVLRQAAGGLGRVAVLGISRGSEAALLLGAHFPDLVGGVAAYVPSSVANVGLGPTPGAPAWTLGGQPVPTAPLREFGDPSPADAPLAIIPVEDVRGPILLVSGTDDHLWPSSRYAAAIVARLDATRDPFPHQSLVYKGAGHGVGGPIPYAPEAPPIVGSHNLGGSPAANARGREDSWPKLLAFLARVPR